MRYQKIFTILFILLFLFPLVSFIVSAQSEEATGAELSIYPVGKIPLIEPNKKITINLSYSDNFGFNWTKNKDKPSLYWQFMLRIVWPLLHPTWRPLFGYCSITFDSEIVGNPTGWSSGISPTSIGQSTDGTKANLQLTVSVTDSAVVNTATIRVSATRFLKDGSNYGTSTFDVLVRSAQLQYISISADENSKEVAPSATTSFTFTVTNLGYFVESFAMKVHSIDNIQGVPSEPSFVLQPGSSRQVIIWAITPETFFDPGTAHVLNISVYSLNNPSKTISAGVTVVTKGYYISSVIFFFIVIIIILLVLIYFLFFYLREKREQQQYGKPEKPWKIPEEKAYLQDLKQDDKAAYEQERQMMDDEYKSAMLWYQHYRATMKRKEEKPKKKLSSLLKKPVEKPKEEKQIQKEKPKKKPSSLLKKPVEKTKEETVTPVVSTEDTSREKAIERIKKEQEKQLRRLK
jgi:uncharacterized membrane protein